MANKNAKKTTTNVNKNSKKSTTTRRTLAEQIEDAEQHLSELRAAEKRAALYSPEAVTAERERLELSVPEYAALVGVGNITMYGWEYGNRVPQDGKLQQWLDVKGISKKEAWKRLGYEEAA